MPWCGLSVFFLRINLVELDFLYANGSSQCKFLFVHYAFARTNTSCSLRQTNHFQRGPVNLRILYLDCDAFLRSSSGAQPLPGLLEHLFMKYPLSHDCSTWDIENQWQVIANHRMQGSLKGFCVSLMYSLVGSKKKHWKSKSLACFYLFWIRKHQLATVPLELAVWCPFVVAAYLVFPSFKRKWSRIYYVYIYLFIYLVCIFLVSLYLYLQ